MSSAHEIAIVGIGCRFPREIDSPHELWQLLLAGGDVIGDIPSDRFDGSYYLDSDRSHAGKTYTVRSGYRTGLADFDAGYFGIAPKEAAKVDPQQRLLLECAADAFDDAQIDPATLAGSDTAVVMGVSMRDYDDLQRRRLRSFNAYNMSGAAPCNTANRISYVYDLRGPSGAIDSACSSSLSSVHQACQEIRTGRSALALAGGVNALLAPADFVGFSKASMLSPTGLCHPFSSNADGFVRAEGAAVILLKPLEQALADGDRIHAVIRASGVNADGRTAGLSLPSATAQADLLDHVYGEAGLDVDRLIYLEAHGTGTQAGDPVECAAMGRALGQRRAEPLPIGSVKANLGHLEAGAGMAGLVKSILVLQHGIAPATPHALPLNEKIDFAGLGLAPVTEARPVRVTESALVGVSSFGFGGANAHVVLAPAPATTAARGTTPLEDGRVRPIMVSGRTEAAARQAATALATHLGDSTDAFYDMAYTSLFRRGRHDHRIVVLAPDAEHAASALRAVAAEQDAPATATGTATRTGTVGFVFSGNGSQWPGMGSDLIDVDAAFTAEVVAADAEMAGPLGWSVLDLLRNPGPADQMAATEVAQPLLFTVQIGIVAALAARGLTPAATCGHSVGEVAAGYACGALDLPTACRIIVERSRAQALTAGLGRMAAVGLGVGDARDALAPYADVLTIAGINSDRDVTIAGDGEALAAFGAELNARAVFFRPLDLDYAFHSPSMDIAAAPLAASLAEVTSGVGRVPMLSTVTGAAVLTGELDADYWWRNIREPVLFADAMRSMVRDHGCEVLIEIGPHPVLATYMRRVAADTSDRTAVLSTLRRDRPGPERLDATVAGAVAAGAAADLSALFPTPGRTVALPAYQWQRERHWTGEADWWREDADDSIAPAQAGDLLGSRLPTSGPAWHQVLEPARAGWLADHRVGATAVFPAAGFIDILLAAGQSVFDGPVELIGVAIDRGLTLPFEDPDPEIKLQTSLGVGGWATICSRSGSANPWQDHVSARVRPLVADEPPPLHIEELDRRLTDLRTAESHYAACARAGLHYGPAFQALTALARGDREVLARYTATLPITVPHPAHPTVLDGALQAGLSLIDGESPVPYLPVRFERIRFWHSLTAAGTVHVRARSGDDRHEVWDIVIADSRGRVALELTGCTLRRFDGGLADTTPLTEVLRAAPLPCGPWTPAPLPTPEQLLAASADDLSRIASARADARYTSFRAHALEVSAHFVVSMLDALVPGRAQVTMTDLLDAGVGESHIRWLRALLAIATECGLLSGDSTESRWTVRVRPAPEAAFRAALEACPGDAVALQTHAICGRLLPGLLLGAVDPIELLFAESDPLATRYYDHAPFMRCGYPVARALLRSAQTDLTPGRPLRVLEFGAGTGGLTSWLLPEFDPRTTTFTYTDISPAFFATARRRFADFDFVDYRPFDLMIDPVEQGFVPGSYDLIFGANALHTAADVSVALGHVRDLLTENGQLVLVETHSEAILTPIFGMLNSYWGFHDLDLRSDGPLVSWEEWPNLLQRCGFHDTIQVGDPADPDVRDFSTIVSVRTPGVTPSPVRVDPIPVEAPHEWIVAATGADGNTASKLGAALEQRTGGRVHLGVDARNEEHWRELLTTTTGVVGIVVLVGDDGDAEAMTDPADQVRRAIAHLGALRALARACEDRPQQVDPQIWIVTRTVSSTLPPREPVSAAVWGAARSLANELLGARVRRICLTRDPDTADPVDAMLEELLSDSAEDEVLVGALGRFVPRVRPLRPSRAPASGSYLATVTDIGLHYRTGWAATAAPEPGPGEIVVAAAAAALNYRDVLMATGLIPTTTGDIGLECAGTVIAVGSGAPFTVGDRVAGVGPGSFGSHVRLRADRAYRIPDEMSFAAAATMPTVFLTVQHSLIHLARLTASETVLIHGAAGGVGLAALQVAQAVGARVIGTAGTPAKRAMLELLGVEHVLDSRSLRFTEEVRRLTAGAGVDVVLNSLAGDALVRSMELLKPHGRFLELGKRDFLADSSLPMAPFLRNLVFFGVDVSPMMTEDSTLADTHFREIELAIRQHRYRPLPYQVYPASRLQDAFTCLQHSRHIGKVVVDLTESVLLDPEPTPARLDPDACYLVTGGLGGFGAATARHLAEGGATQLALVSRSGDSSPEAASLLADLAQRGVRAAAYAADCADPVAMRRIIEEIGGSGRRIAGAVHAAMVLNDTPLLDAEDDVLRSVLSPKMGGGIVLDALLPAADFVVYYSSVSALIGNISQSAYAAANLAIEALAGRASAAGRTALAIQWGAISDVGYVHRTRIGHTVAELGVRGMDSQQVLGIMDELLDLTGRRRIGSTVTVADIDWAATRKFLYALAAPRTAELLPVHTDTGVGLRDKLKETAPKEALHLIQDTLCDMVAQILQTTPERIDRLRRLDHIGVDSLMAAELATNVRRTFGCELPTVELATAAGVNPLAQVLLARTR
ncbi:SDR family NAD(P)-dependent oxidoreductase [Nocardia sp. NBC_01503]|uniref:SDR family NAD(P)-dependent oxidoreductase n=1 Tax=Nocardia sp. NBC_01503 TaxID=2975997 RepID=UPI002E7AE57C|nr:SDR family NAD(P)-dependent oxidoreductase [Nocardia sp. NBC_01503]WTL31314.1 SDR family NAD(P)-dependent oxidoreductase [Nocardia sp. NBC_01503]